MGRGSSVATSASAPSEARTAVTCSTMELEIDSAAVKLNVVKLFNNVVSVLRA